MAASPHIIVFSIFSAATGAPLTGQTPTFLTYADETGVAITSPTISEIGGGLYKFTPTFTAGHTACFMIDTGASSASRYTFGCVRPEDFYIDYLLDLEDELFGKWQVFTSGPDANRLVLYRQDGVTVLKKFDLQNAAGSPTSTQPFVRLPV